MITAFVIVGGMLGFLQTFFWLVRVRGDDQSWGPLRAESLRRFAARRGLWATETGRCAGAIDGVTVALFIDKRSRDGGPADCAVLRCGLGAAPAGLVLTESSNAVRVLRNSGAGAALPDAAAPPTTGDPVRSLLADAEVRACLLSAVHNSQWLCISNGVLELSSDRGFDTPGLAALLEPGLALVKAIRAAHARGQAARAAPTAGRAG